jgi:ABC-2 type transport system ATP-binding protein
MVLEVTGLRKEFGDVTALDGVDLSVAEGEVFGFLGPNGAGKSTTINVVLDFVKPTAGSVTVFGMDAAERSRAVRARTGALLEGYGAYPELTGREHVEHAVATKDADDDPDELLDRVGLDERDRRAGGYSKGMRQRMALAVALVGDPDLLVLDEPTTGLDPNGARLLRELVAEEAARGATVFFSSHVLEQVEAVADRVGILLDGEMATVGDVDDLRGTAGAGVTLSVAVDAVTDGLVETVRAVEGVTAVTPRDGGQLAVTCTDGPAKLAALNAVADSGVYRDFAVEEGSLDDAFSRYTGADGVAEAGAGEAGTR